jgi:hypothetical protein
MIAAAQNWKATTAARNSRHRIVFEERYWLIQALLANGVEHYTAVTAGAPQCKFHGCSLVPVHLRKVNPDLFSLQFA